MKRLTIGLLYHGMYNRVLHTQNKGDNNPLPNIALYLCKIEILFISIAVNFNAIACFVCVHNDF